MNKNIYRNILLLEQYKKLETSLKNNSIHLIPVKGIGLLLDKVADFKSRELEDIDILVKKEDLENVIEILKEEGYNQVSSGEISYYNSDEFAIVDIHTEIDYINQKRFNTFFDNDCKNRLEPLEHIIYIIYHALIHHGINSYKWKEDVKLLLKDVEIKELEDMFKFYKMKDLYRLSMNYLDYTDQEYIRKPSLRYRYMDFIIKRCSYDDKGHLIIPFAVSDMKYFFNKLANYLFPGKEFLKRRYETKNTFILAVIRPVLLLLKVFQSTISFNLSKNSVK